MKVKIFEIDSKSLKNPSLKVMMALVLDLDSDILNYKIAWTILLWQL